MITFKARKLKYQDTVLEHTTLYIEDDLKSRLHSLQKIIGIFLFLFYETPHSALLLLFAFLLKGFFKISNVNFGRR